MFGLGGLSFSFEPSPAAGLGLATTRSALFDDGNDEEPQNAPTSTNPLGLQLSTTPAAVVHTEQNEYDAEFDAMKAEQERFAETSILARHKATALVALPLANLDNSDDQQREAPKFIPKLLAQARERNEEFERLRFQAQDDKLKELKDRLGITQEFITQEYQQHTRLLSESSSSSSSSTPSIIQTPPEAEAVGLDTSTVQGEGERREGERREGSLSIEEEVLETIAAESEQWPVVDERYIQQARRRYFARLKKTELF